MREMAPWRNRQGKRCRDCVTRHPRRRRIEGGGLVFSVLEEASSWMVAVSDDDAGAAIGRCSVLDDAGGLLLLASAIADDAWLHICFTYFVQSCQHVQTCSINVAAAQLFRLAQLQLLQQLSHLGRFVPSAKPSQAAWYLSDTPFATQSLPQPPVHPMSIASACRHEAGR